MKIYPPQQPLTDTWRYVINSLVRPVDTSDSSVGRAVIISGEDSNVQ